MAWAALVAAAVQQKQAGDKQAEVDEYNAQVSEQEGEAAQASADFDAKQYLRKASSLISTQRANAAASGLGLEGSPVEVMDETARQAAFDALLIKYSGSVAAARATSQATLDRMAGGTAKSDGTLGAGATLLSGYSSLSGAYGGGKKLPATGAPSQAARNGS